MERLRAMFESLPKEAPGRMDEGSLFSSFQTNKGGISESEARRRLAALGPNELAIRSVNGWRVALRQFRSSMVYLLEAAAAVSFAFGERVDGITIVVILFINAVIGFSQEFHSEKAVEKLREKLSARARVRRDGDIVSVERRLLVPGDVVVLEPGDIVDADLRLFISHRLTLDESSLTGESTAVEKTATADLVDGRIGPPTWRT